MIMSDMIESPPGSTPDGDCPWEGANELQFRKSSAEANRILTEKHKAARHSHKFDMEYF